MSQTSQEQLLMVESIQYGSQEISFSVSWRDRKTLAIEVHPDLAVVVVAPVKTTLVEIKARVLKRARWILKQWNYFDQFLPRTPEREYVSGESHVYLGKKYVLKVRKATQEQARLKGGIFEVESMNPANTLRTKQLMASWYKAHASTKFQSVFEQALGYFEFAETPSFKVRRMKNRWGSCSSSGVITLNPEIIKAPTRCIEYVVVHELCHLLHPDHSRKFYNQLERVMPDWQRWKLRLEKNVV